MIIGNKIEKRREDIINFVDLNLRKYLAMKPDIFPLDILDGKARLHRISDNSIRLDIRGQDY